jgi:hypothetical protein
VGGYVATVIDASRRRVQRLRLRPVMPEEDEAAQESGSA